MPQNSKKPITAWYYSRKQTTKGAKFPSQTFAGLGHTLLKKCYPITIIWYAKSAPTRRKFFIEWGYDNSHPTNRYTDIPVTQREWQPDPEVVITHDDLYARAWECENDEPIFDSDNNNLAVPNPPEITVRSEQTADELRNTPGIKPENSPEIIPQPDKSYDGRDVDRDTQPDADTSVEQLYPMPTNPGSSKYDLRHNPKPNCNDDYRY